MKYTLALLFGWSTVAHSQIIVTTLGSVSHLTTSTVNATTCSPPPSFTSFTPDGKIYAYFEVNALLPGVNVSAHWIRSRDNFWFATTSWSNAHDGCFLGAYLDTSWLSPADYGDWRVEIYLSDSKMDSRSFTITSGNPPPNPSSNYIGYFDGMDCNHFWGWAYDPGNPGRPVSIDIYVDNSKVATVIANESRSDLSGNYAFNFYGLPPSIKDLQQHSVRVMYAGTNQELRNSPKTFQNACGSTSSTLYSWDFNPYVTHIPQPENWLCGPSTAAMWIDFINREYGASFGPTTPQTIAVNLGIVGETSLDTFMNIVWSYTPWGYTVSSIGYSDSHAAVRGILAKIAQYGEPVAIVGGDRFGILQNIFGWSSGSHYLLIRGGRASRNPYFDQSENNHMIGVWINDATEGSDKYPNGPVSGMYRNQIYTPERLMQYWGTTGPWYPYDKRWHSIERDTADRQVLKNDKSFSSY